MTELREDSSIVATSFVERCDFSAPAARAAGVGRYPRVELRGGGAEDEGVTASHSWRPSLALAP